MRDRERSWKKTPNPDAAVTQAPMDAHQGPAANLHSLLTLQRGAGNAATNLVVHAEQVQRTNGGAVAAPPAPVPPAPGPAMSPRARIAAAGYDWSRVKDLYAEARPSTMKFLVIFRKFTVSSIIDEMRAEFPDLETRIVGSESLTSDYDVTFLGERGAAAVAEFNRRFAASWAGFESGVVFDTNVYAEDVLPGAKPTAGAPDEATLLSSDDTSRDVDAHLDTTLQDVASLVKIRKNMSAREWDSFTGTVVAAYGTSGGGALQAEAAARFAQANTMYQQTYVGLMFTKLAESPATRARVAHHVAAGASQNAIVEELAGAPAGIAASNRIYEEKLAAAALLEGRRSEEPRGSSRWKTLTVDLRRAKTDAMLFANEPYFSAGTLFHVVGNIQQKWQLPLGAAPLFQSLNENYGDFKKEIHYLHGRAFATVAVKSSKYAFRVLDAAVALQSQGITGPHDPTELRTVMGKVLDVRQAKEGAGTKEEAVVWLAEIGIASTDQMVTKLDEIAIELNIKARQSRRGV